MRQGCIGAGKHAANLHGAMLPSPTNCTGSCEGMNLFTASSDAPPTILLARKGLLTRHIPVGSSLKEDGMAWLITNGPLHERHIPENQPAAATNGTRPMILGWPEVSALDGIHGLPCIGNSPLGIYRYAMP